MKTSTFIFDSSWLSVLTMLSAESRWRIILAINEYASNSAVSLPLSESEAVAFDLIRPELGRQITKRRKISEIRRKAATRRRKTDSSSDNEQLQANASKCSAEKETKKEKENLPHTPSKEKEINKEKEADAVQRARTGEAWMPQKGGKVNTMQFNYYIGDTLVNTKYRTADKCFRLEAGARLIPYNIDAIRDTPECIITEGEMDALSFAEIGRHDVLSVPNGANGNLCWLDDFMEDVFEKKSQIFIAVDTDEKGRLLRYRAQGNVLVKVEKVKFRHLGETGRARLMYNLTNGRYAECHAGKETAWDDSNHLTERRHEQEKRMKDEACFPTIGLPTPIPTGIPRRVPTAGP